MDSRITVPNVLTVSRIAMAGLAAYLVVRLHADAVAVAVLIAAAVLDACDGWCARSFGQHSSLGEHLDPLADKLLMAVVYVWIAADAAATVVWVLVAVIAAREAGMTLLRSYSLRRHGRFIPASRLGRAKMFVQSVVGLTILGVAHFLRRPMPVGVVAAGVGAALVVSYLSGGAYALAWRRTYHTRLAAVDESKGVCRRPEADPLCATHDHG